VLTRLELIETANQTWTTTARQCGSGVASKKARHIQEMVLEMDITNE
jgi:hypothetical protein